MAAKAFPVLRYADGRSELRATAQIQTDIMQPYAVHFDERGEWLLMLNSSRSLALFSADYESPRIPLSGPQAPITCCTIAKLPNGPAGGVEEGEIPPLQQPQVVIAGTEDGHVYVWELHENPQVIALLQLFPNNRRVLGLAVQGSRVLGFTDDGFAWIHLDGFQVHSVDIPEEVALEGSPTGVWAIPSAVASALPAAPGSTFLATCGKEIIFFAPAGAEELVVSGLLSSTKSPHSQLQIRASTKTAEESLEALGISAGAAFLAAGRCDGAVVFYACDGQLLSSVPGSRGGHADRIVSMDSSPNGGLLVTGSSDCAVKLWSWRSMLPLQTITKHTNRVAFVKFNPVHALFASAAHDSTVKLWRPNGTMANAVRGHTGYVRHVEFHPAGHQMVSCSQDGTARVTAMPRRLDVPLWLDTDMDGGDVNKKRASPLRRSVSSAGVVRVTRLSSVGSQRVSDNSEPASPRTLDNTARPTDPQTSSRPQDQQQQQLAPLTLSPSVAETFESEPSSPISRNSSQVVMPRRRNTITRKKSVSPAGGEGHWREPPGQGARSTSAVLGRRATSPALLSSRSNTPSNAGRSSSTLHKSRSGVPDSGTMNSVEVQRIKKEAASVMSRGLDAGSMSRSTTAPTLTPRRRVASNSQQSRHAPATTARVASSSASATTRRSGTSPGSGTSKTHTLVSNVFRSASGYARTSSNVSSVATTETGGSYIDADEEPQVVIHGGPSLRDAIRPRHDDPAQTPDPKPPLQRIHVGAERAVPATREVPVTVQAQPQQPPVKRSPPRNDASAAAERKLLRALLMSSAQSPRESTGLDLFITQPLKNVRAKLRQLSYEFGLKEIDQVLDAVDRWVGAENDDDVVGMPGRGITGSDLRDFLSGHPPSPVLLASVPSPLARRLVRFLREVFVVLPPNPAGVDVALASYALHLHDTIDALPGYQGLCFRWSPTQLPVPAQPGTVLALPGVPFCSSSIEDAVSALMNPTDAQLTGTLVAIDCIRGHRAGNGHALLDGGNTIVYSPFTQFVVADDVDLVRERLHDRAAIHLEDHPKLSLWVLRESPE